MKYKSKPKTKPVSSKAADSFFEQKRKESILGQKKVKKAALDAAYAGRLPQ